MKNQNILVIEVYHSTDSFVEIMFMYQYKTKSYVFVQRIEHYYDVTGPIGS